MIRVVRAVPTGAKALADLLLEVDDFYGEPTRETVGSKLANINSALFR